MIYCFFAYLYTFPSAQTSIFELIQNNTHSSDTIHCSGSGSFVSTTSPPQNKNNPDMSHYTRTPQQDDPEGARYSFQLERQSPCILYKYCTCVLTNIDIIDRTILIDIIFDFSQHTQGASTLVTQKCAAAQMRTIKNNFMFPGRGISQ